MPEEKLAALFSDDPSDGTTVADGQPPDEDQQTTDDNEGDVDDAGQNDTQEADGSEDTAGNEQKSAKSNMDEDSKAFFQSKYQATKTEKDKLEGELKSLRAQMILDRQSGRKTEDGQPEVDENGKTEFENFMANPSGYMNQMLEQREMVVEYKQTVKQTTDELHQWATDNNRERELDEAQKFFADPSFAWPSGTSIPERARLIKLVASGLAANEIVEEAHANGVTEGKMAIQRKLGRASSGGSSAGLAKADAAPQMSREEREIQATISAGTNRAQGLAELFK
jgi:hypothetical protein